jgi:hypothetical protein
LTWVRKFMELLLEFFSPSGQWQSSTMRSTSVCNFCFAPTSLRYIILMQDEVYCIELLWWPWNVRWNTGVQEVLGSNSWHDLLNRKEPTSRAWNPLWHLCKYVLLISLLVYYLLQHVPMYFRLIGLLFNIADCDRRFESRQGLGTFHHRVQTGSGAHPVSYPMVNRGSFLGVKRPEHEADHSSPSTAEVKNSWSCTSTPPIRLHGMVLS